MLLKSLYAVLPPYIFAALFTSFVQSVVCKHLMQPANINTALKSFGVSLRLTSFVATLSSTHKLKIIRPPYIYLVGYRLICFALNTWNGIRYITRHARAGFPGGVRVWASEELFWIFITGSVSPFVKVVFHPASGYCFWPIPFLVLRNPGRAHWNCWRCYCSRCRWCSHCRNCWSCCN